MKNLTALAVIALAGVVVKAVDRYPEEAYHFVREGLDYAVEQVHGPPSPALRRICEYLAAHQIEGNNTSQWLAQILAQEFTVYDSFEPAEPQISEAVCSTVFSYKSAPAWQKKMIEVVLAAGDGQFKSLPERALKRALDALVPRSP